MEQPPTGVVNFTEGEDHVSMDIDDGGQAAKEFASDGEITDHTTHDDTDSESDDQLESQNSSVMQSEQSEGEYYSQSQSANEEDNSQFEPGKSSRGYKRKK